MGQIHPTAIIEPGARVGESVRIGPYCHIGPRVEIGAGSRLVGNVTVLGRTTIGKGNTIWPYAVLGADPQDLKYHGEPTELRIGDNNEIRETVTIHPGTDNGGGVTRVGNENLLMVGVHVAHDCVVEDHVILGNAVHLAGHVYIHNHAVVSGATGIHHYVTIGPYAFIGGMTRLVHDVPPFLIVEGNPSKVRGVNVIGMNRHRFEADTIQHLKDAYRRLFRGGGSRDKAGGAPNMSESIAELEANDEQDECVQMLIQFIRRSSIGLHGRYRESERTDQRLGNPVK